MFKNAKEVIKYIKDNDVKMVDFKMVDINGVYRHVTIPASGFKEELMKTGIGFDASNYGYAVVEKSDMVFIPDVNTAMMDPFCDVPTLSMSGDVMIIDYPKNRPLPHYPRNIVKAAEAYMKKTGIADKMIILPEFEFYLFDEVGWRVDSNHQEAHVDFNQAYWNSHDEGSGNVVPFQKNYHVAKPQDTTYDCRSEMVLRMEEAGIPIKYHHPEVSASGQFEIEPQLGEMSKMADASMMIKYIIKNVAQEYGLSASFMPKPIFGINGSGMHCNILILARLHIILWADS